MCPPDCLLVGALATREKGTTANHEPGTYFCSRSDFNFNGDLGQIRPRVGKLTVAPATSQTSNHISGW